MTRHRSLAACTVIFVLSLLIGGKLASAHEAAMGVLEMRQINPTQYLGQWVLAPSMDTQSVHFVFPPQCAWDGTLLECASPGLVGPVTIANLGANMSAVMLRVVPLQGEDQSYTLTVASPKATVVGSSTITWETWREIAQTYLNLGIDHILLGVDHLLFVLGLIWIVRGGWLLVETITAFTVGHSLSLAATAFGWIGVPEKPLNAVIALSIVFVGVEIIKLARGEGGLTARFPWAVAGGFGLVHGIGFASALVSLGIQRHLLPVALVSFNVGVEIGQLAFVGLVLALMWAHRTLTATLPRWSELLPGYAIGVPAMFWFSSRMVRLVAT